MIIGIGAFLDKFYESYTETSLFKNDQENNISSIFSSTVLLSVIHKNNADRSVEEALSRSKRD